MIGHIMVNWSRSTFTILFFVSLFQCEIRNSSFDTAREVLLYHGTIAQMKTHRVISHFSMVLFHGRLLLWLCRLSLESSFTKKWLFLHISHSFIPSWLVLPLVNFKRLHDAVFPLTFVSPPPGCYQVHQALSSPGFMCSLCQLVGSFAALFLHFKTGKSSSLAPADLARHNTLLRDGAPKTAA